MKAVLFPAKGAVEIANLADPRPEPDEVVIEVRAAGICHTDIEVLRGNYGTGAFPLVACHEFAGVVCEIGAEVADLKPGDRVVVDPNIECGTCRACRRGWAHLCERLGAYGVTVNGGFAERCAVAATAVHKIGDMPFDLAALAEPMGCVLNGVAAAHRDTTRNALIIGAGPMGLLMAVALRTRGLDDIALVDIDENRLSMTENFGFTALAADTSEIAARGRPSDLVVEATGVPSVVAEALDFVADGGTLHIFGVSPRDLHVSFSPFEIFRRQLSIVGSHSLNHNIPGALETLRAAGLEIGRLVTHRLDLRGIAETLSGHPPPGAMKVQFAA